MQIKSVETLLKVIREEEDPDRQMMFRGQTRDWPLLPSIGRNPRAVEYSDNWRVFHDVIVEDFLRLGRPFFQQRPTSDVEAWIHAQHHGLPTRLLDWTTNPLKGLFFR